MVTVYNTRNSSTMDAATIQKILEAGVPLELYKSGILHLGANNRKALERCANIGTQITREKLPLPPSLFIEFVCDLTSGSDVRDYRMTLDGEPGDGKSYTSLYLAARYAIEMSSRMGGVPTDYFSLKNCALLQDTAGVTKLLNEVGKYQAVVIDDAGIAAGNRNYGTKDNKDIDAIMQVCRTKRWFLIYNAPNRRHVDLHIRELVYSKGYIYKPCHAAGMNIIKIHREKIDTTRRQGNEFKQRYTLGGKKISFFMEYSTELLDPFKGMMKEYDKNREKATEQLIQERANSSEDRKNPRSKSDIKWQEKVTKYYDYVKEQYEAHGEKLKTTNITKDTGLNYRSVLKMIAMVKKGEKNE